MQASEEVVAGEAVAGSEVKLSYFGRVGCRAGLLSELCRSLGPQCDQVARNSGVHNTFHTCMPGNVTLW